MALVEDVLPAFTLLLVKDDVIEFLHQRENVLQGLNGFVFLQQFLQLVDILFIYKVVFLQDIDNIGRVEDVFLFQQLIQLNNQLHALDVGLVVMLNVFHQLCHFVFILLYQHFNGQVILLQQLGQHFVNSLYPDAVGVNQRIDILGQYLLQMLLVQVLPEIDNVQSNLDMRVVTFGVNLFPQEVNQLVVAV